MLFENQAKKIIFFLHCGSWVLKTLAFIDPARVTQMKTTGILKIPHKTLKYVMTQS